MEKASESTGPVVKFSAPYGDIQVRKGHVAGKEKKMVLLSSRRRVPIVAQSKISYFVVRVIYGDL